MKKKKILVLYASFGAGHKKAAKALVEAFSAKYPDIEIKNIDVLEFGFRIFSKGAPAIFDYITAETPFFYKWIYDFCNHLSRYKFLNHASNFFVKKTEFTNFIMSFNPDFILSTNPLPMQLVSGIKQKNIRDILSANVCTDFGFHSFWHNPDVNYYFVQNENIKKSLISHGVHPDNIKVAGIPIGLSFAHQVDRQEILNDLKFSTSRPVLLIVGGKIIYKNLLKVINGVKEKNNSVQFIIIAGRDRKLQRQLKKSEISEDLSVRIFDFVDNLDEYMEVADLIFTKAGGLTVAECLAKGLPMLINDIMPGQERDNLDYLISRGAGVEVKTAEGVVESVVDLFSHPEKLAKMKQNCLNVAKPNAAVEIADFIASLFPKIR